MAIDTTSRIQGSVLGLALGDAFGAPYEGGFVERVLWRVIGTSRGKRRWTDDTQTAIDVSESLIACGRIDQEDLARRLAAGYRWSRGYGPGAARVLKRIGAGVPHVDAARSVYRDGSWGNGGAMRSPVVGLFFAARGDEAVRKAAADACAVTHLHPFAREGAAMVALATALSLSDESPSRVMARLNACCESPEFTSRLDTATTWLRSGDVVEPRRVATELGNAVSAVESCVTSVYVGLVFREKSFEQMLEFAVALRGDVDTIAAMSGAIWGAARGVDALPVSLLSRLEQRDRLADVAHRLAAASVLKHDG
jgi:ADP-ribosylglycohydrolase